ncbi:DNA alkylation repair protein [Candidatus Pacearchaeota archaeon]|nr:DNA alkylation repair protein [Candidatus Pacearchaeota archaeon]
MDSLTKALHQKANLEKSKIMNRFFKTGKGQYGEGDIFLGLTVPQSRIIAKQFKEINLNELKIHLQSKIHEERLIALLILVEKYKKTKDKEIVKFYLSHKEKINNWDLVDLTSHKILGDYIQDKDKSIIYKLAKSDNLWEKRISIISTFAFIKNNQFQDALKISKLLLEDKHDLIHKSVGWMLREIGKRDLQLLEKFLKENYSIISRTTLRYAIEKFSKFKRQAYLKGEL